MAGSQARLLSRNEKDFGAKFPEIMDSIAELNVQDDIGQRRPPIFFYAFDLLQINGKDLKQLSLEKRKAILEKLINKAPCAIRYSAALGDDAEPLLEQARKLGLEGLIGKKKDSIYEVGQRSGSWIKLKLLEEQEFVIGGYTEPEGTRKYFGSLVVGFYRGKELVFAGKVGTGFNTKLLRSLFSGSEKIYVSRVPL